MFRRLLFFIALFLVLPSSAGEFEAAIKNNQKVFLYITSPECGRCVRFNPIYKNISSKYSKQMKFIKVDLESPYGRNLMRTYKGWYLPFVMVVNPEKGLNVKISPDCLLENACVESYIKDYIQ